MQKLIVTISFVIIFCGNAFAYNKIRLYSANSSASKVIFHVAEASTDSLGIPLTIVMEEEDAIINSLQNENKIDLIITDNYNLLRSLKEEGIVNFKFVSEIFYDKLVYVSLNGNGTNIASSIFLKTDEKDSDLIDNLTNKIPFTIVQGEDLCKNVNDLIIYYRNLHEYAIIKESVAKKCKISYSSPTDGLYNLYYIAAISNENLISTKKIIEFTQNSSKIKDIITKNGYKI